MVENRARSYSEGTAEGLCAAPAALNAATLADGPEKRRHRACR